MDFLIKLFIATTIVAAMLPPAYWVADLLQSGRYPSWPWRK